MDTQKKERILYGAIALLLLMVGVQFCTRNSGSDKSIYFSNKNKEELIERLDALESAMQKQTESIQAVTNEVYRIDGNIEKVNQQNVSIIRKIDALQSDESVTSKRRK